MTRDFYDRVIKVPTKNKNIEIANNLGNENLEQYRLQGAVRAYKVVSLLMGYHPTKGKYRIEAKPDSNNIVYYYVPEEIYDRYLYIYGIILSHMGPNNTLFSFLDNKEYVQDPHASLIIENVMELAVNILKWEIPECFKNMYFPKINDELKESTVLWSVIYVLYPILKEYKKNNVTTSKFIHNKITEILPAAKPPSIKSISDYFIGADLDYEIFIANKLKNNTIRSDKKTNLLMVLYSMIEITKDNCHINDINAFLSENLNEFSIPDINNNDLTSLVKSMKQMIKNEK